MNTRLMALIFKVLLLSVFFVFISGLACNDAVARVSYDADLVKSKYDALKDTPHTEDELNQELLQRYSNILNNLNETKSNRDQAEKYRKDILQNPQVVKDIYVLINNKQGALSNVSISVNSQTPITQVEQALIEAKASRNANVALLSELDSQKLNELDRPETIALGLSDASRVQQEILAEIQNPSDVSSLPELKKAQHWLLESKSEVIRSNIEKLEQEMLSQQYRIELIDARKSLASLESSIISKHITQLDLLLGTLRQKEAQQAKQQAGTEILAAASKHILVRQLAENNAKTSDLLSSMVEQLDTIGKETALIDDELKRLKTNFSSVSKQIDIAGITQAFGYVLLDQQRSLPDTRNLVHKTKLREQEFSDIGLRKFKNDIERRSLINSNEYITKITKDFPEEERIKTSQDMEEPVQRRLTLLSKSLSIERALLSAMAAQDLAERRLIDYVKVYQEYLSSRMFWMRTSPHPSLEILSTLPSEFIYFLAPKQWQEVFESIIYSIQNVYFIFGFLVFITLISFRKKLRKAIPQKAQHVRNDKFSYTLNAFGFGLILALPWPMLFYIVGYEISLMDHSSDFVKSFSEGLMRISSSLYYLLVAKVFCEKGGVADAHFKWPSSRLSALKIQINKLIFIVLPLAFCVVMTSNSEVKSISEPLSRLFVVSFLIVLPLCWYKVFLPESGAFSHKNMKAKGNSFANLSYLWFLMYVGMPLVLAVLAFVGYLYSALILIQLLLTSLLLLVVLLCFHQLIARWLTLVQRKLRYQTALEKREATKQALQAKREKGGNKEEPQAGTEGVFEIETPELDIYALSQESRELLSSVLLIVGIAGFWIIWEDVVSSLTFWSDFTLWESVIKDGGVEHLVPVTFSDFLFAAAVFLVTVISAKKIPSLIEILLLQQFGVHAGERYAAKTLVRYLIITVGTLWTLSKMGASWGQIQWLAAAIGVGIGFGLQEIVANFISGLIILFERPIRVGDVVTVGDVDGVVTRIQIRATTIRNWDRKELLVPNKEFVTQRLLNWTLSDQTTRILFPIGLAYGTDVHNAMALITKVAKENENVLEDPSPFVTFESFGDNSITLYLRTYVGSIDYRLITVSALHAAIYTKLNEEGIVISFPQRDLHIDTLSPLEIKMVQSAEAKS